MKFIAFKFIKKYPNPTILNLGNIFDNRLLFKTNKDAIDYAKKYIINQEKNKFIKFNEFKIKPYQFGIDEFVLKGSYYEIL